MRGVILGACRMVLIAICNVKNQYTRASQVFHVRREILRTRCSLFPITECISDTARRINRTRWDDKNDGNDDPHTEHCDSWMAYFIYTIHKRTLGVHPHARGETHLAEGTEYDVSLILVHQESVAVNSGRTRVSCDCAVKHAERTRARFSLKVSPMRRIAIVCEIVNRVHGDDG